MKRIISSKVAQYWNDPGRQIDRAVEDWRARGVEESYQQRYRQEPEEYEVWGYFQRKGPYRITEDPYPTIAAAKAIIIPDLEDYKAEGWTDIYVALTHTDGDREVTIWDIDDEEPEEPEQPPAEPML